MDITDLDASVCCVVRARSSLVVDLRRYSPADSGSDRRSRTANEHTRRSTDTRNTTTRTLTDTHIHTHDVDVAVFVHLPPHYSIPPLRTRFTHAGTATWNALPDNIRTVADPARFRKLWK